MKEKKVKEVKVKEPKVKEAKVKEAKVHLSTFLITVNSQIDDKKFIPRLRDSYDKFYAQITDYIKDKTDKVILKSISSESAIERGERRHAYHLHALLKIEHTGKIHMNLEKMRSFFDKEVKGDGKNYFQVKYINDPTFNIREYFRKEK
jgi:hypothetical protein